MNHDLCVLSKHAFERSSLSTLSSSDRSFVSFCGSESLSIVYKANNCLFTKATHLLAPYCLYSMARTSDEEIYIQYVRAEAHDIRSIIRISTRLSAVLCPAQPWVGYASHGPLSGCPPVRAFYSSSRTSYPPQS